MLSDQEKVDLGRRRGRAYGRGDAISDLDLARLRDLEARAADRPVTGAATDAGSTEPGSTGGGQSGPGLAGSSPEGPSVEPSSSQRASSARGRRGVLLPVAAGVLGLALGAGITAALSTPSPTVVTTDRDARLSPTAADQLPGVAELGRWDEDSLTVLGGLDATTIWSATRESGDETCVIVYSAVERRGLTVTCNDTETVTEDGVAGVVSVYDVGGSSAVFGFQANPALDPAVVFRRQ